MQVYNDDCFNIFPKINNESIDMVLCDLPYNTTKNKWDCCLNLSDLWKEYKRIVKPNGAIVLFAQTPFDKVLGCSNLEMLKYEWIWEKDNGTGIYNCNFAPLKKHENILVFSRTAACYVKNTSMAMKYHPQKSVGKPYKRTGGVVGSNYDQKWQKEVFTENKGDRYPTSILKFQRDKEHLHPTQKPLALCEYLIKTYSDEGDLILDNCAGSGTTLLAAKNLNRDFIGIEKDKNFFEIINKRLGGGMATFNYQEMQNDTLELLSEFGDSFTLKKPYGESVYNPKTKKQEQNFKNYNGICVMKTYTTDAIGEMSNVIQAGDVEFKCQMDNASIIPKEKVDKIVFGGITYNVINVATINPSGNCILLHTLHCQRAN